jgi:hypothetical protein
VYAACIESGAEVFAKIFPQIPCGAMSDFTQHPCEIDHSQSFLICGDGCGLHKLLHTGILDIRAKQA